MEKLSKVEKIVYYIARYLLGAIFFVFGIIGALAVLGIDVMPKPDFSFKMQIVMKGFGALVYFMPLVKIIEIFAGLLLLRGIYINLAIVLLLPIAVNILGVHLFVDPAGLPIAIVIAVCLGVLCFFQCEEFKRFLFKK